jgi:lipoprotein-anchoring transpeptidase ErfK/SrfK
VGAANTLTRGEQFRGLRVNIRRSASYSETTMVLRRLMICGVAVCVLVAAPTAASRTGVAPALPASYPAAGELVVQQVAARQAPDPEARLVRKLHQFRGDYRVQIVLATGHAVGADGRTWFHINLPMRPNGTTGWIPAGTVALRPMHSRIVVHRARKVIEVFRGARRALTAKVAVGAPGRETPLGEFYVTARFHPDDPFLGVFALETSAYSRLTEWPGGGVVGIHGTSKPWLLGQAVSHGCVRVSNATALQLKRLAPLGTPISIVAR